jgi:hypothetical protein
MADHHYYPHDLANAVECPTFSAAASPVRTSATPGNALASTASARDYGQSSPELLASYDPATSSWRTSQLCLDGELSEFSETWPRSGLMRNGTAYQLPPLVRLTDATECGLLPTPSANQSIACSMEAARNEAARLHPQGRWTLATIISEELPASTVGSLNPTFVEWLMGYPRDWTEI